MHVGLYARVSTEDQTTENQLIPLREWADKEGHTYTEYVDVASGAKQSRTQLNNLLIAIRQGDVQGVIVYKFDRLGRSLQHLLQLVEEFRNKKVQFVSITEQINTETAQGRFFLQVAGAFAEFERELIRERVNAGLSRAKKQGKKLGRPAGSKDKKARRKSGYYMRWSKQ